MRVGHSTAMDSIGGAALYGLAAGFGIAMPLGAIAVLILRTALSRGMRAGAAAGLGAATVDFVYCSLAVLAGASLSGAISSWGDAPLYVSGAVITAIGIAQLVSALRPTETVAATPRTRIVYVQFIGLTALNPVTVLYFASLAGVLSSHQADAGAQVTFVVAVALASAVWQVGLGIAGAVMRHTVGDRASRVLSIVGSLIVVVLGAVIIVRTALA